MMTAMVNAFFCHCALLELFKKKSLLGLVRRITNSVQMVVLMFEILKEYFLKCL